MSLFRALLLASSSFMVMRFVKHRIREIHTDSNAKNKVKNDNPHSTNK